MYDLPYFKDQKEQRVLDFIKDHPFALISGSNASGEPFATQIPLFLESESGKQFLRGHMMKNNDHHIAFTENPKVMAVFSSPHTYVSATWYENPHQASTWNYMSVHAKGAIKFLDDSALIDILKKTTLYFEKGNTASSTYFNNLSEKYTKPLMRAIVAFEIEVEKLDHVFKLSQNKDEVTFLNIIKQLDKGDTSAQYIAQQMKERYSELFKH